MFYDDVFKVRLLLWLYMCKLIESILGVCAFVVFAVNYFVFFFLQFEIKWNTALTVIFTRIDRLQELSIHVSSRNTLDIHFDLLDYLSSRKLIKCLLQICLLETKRIHFAMKMIILN